MIVRDYIDLHGNLFFANIMFGIILIKTWLFIEQNIAI